MIVKLDEDLSHVLVERFAARGYDVRTVRDQGWAGFKDDKLWPLVQDEGAFFVTADKEFGDLRKFPAGTRHGILLLRPCKEKIPLFLSAVDRALETHALADLQGCLLVADERRVRVRKK